MADLIIKPSSGGSLKLQEDGGTDALTIDASGNTTLAGAANNLGTISSATTFPAGHVLQVKTTNVSSNSVTCTTAQNTFTTVPTLQVAITPSATSSKILVMVYIGAYNFSSTNYGISGSGVLQRKIASGSFTGIGLGSGNTYFNPTFSLPQQDSSAYYSGIMAQTLDSPSTESECTYAVGVADHNNDARTFYLNQKVSVADTPWQGYFSSAITAMEIKG